MKTKYDNLLWGILLILAAGLVFAQQQGWISWLNPQFWELAFAGLAAIFLVRYLLAGLRNWGWLFPACIFLALAGMVWMGAANSHNAWLPAPFFGAIALPFLVAFAVDVRKHWWALIPATVMLLCGGVIVFSNQVPGEFIGAAFMFALAISFLAVYLNDRGRSWAVIPAFVMASIGVIILLEAYFDQWSGAFVPIAIALPFFYVYIRQPERRWWSLIPAGIMASIGVNVLLTMPGLGRFGQSSIPTAIMFMGWAATFGWLWLQREKSLTTWARFPAMIFGIISVVLLVTGSINEIGLTFVLVLAGLALIYLGLRPRKDTPSGQIKP